MKDRRPPAFSCRKRFWFVCFALLEASFVFVLLATSPDSAPSIPTTWSIRFWGRPLFQLAQVRRPFEPPSRVLHVLRVGRVSGDLLSGQRGRFGVLLPARPADVRRMGLRMVPFVAQRPRGSRLCVVLAAAFYLLSPVLAAHAPLMWKDVPFAIVVVVLVLKLFDFSRADHLSRKDVAVLFALLSGLCLLRNNGLYVSLAVLAYLLAVLPGVPQGRLLCARRARGRRLRPSGPCLPRALHRTRALLRIGRRPAAAGGGRRRAGRGSDGGAGGIPEPGDPSRRDGGPLHPFPW